MASSLKYEYKLCFYFGDTLLLLFLLMFLAWLRWWRQLTDAFCYRERRWRTDSPIGKGEAASDSAMCERQIITQPLCQHRKSLCCGLLRRYAAINTTSLKLFQSKKHLNRFLSIFSHRVWSGFRELLSLSFSHWMMSHSLYVCFWQCGISTLTPLWGN